MSRTSAFEPDSTGNKWERNNAICASSAGAMIYAFHPPFPTAASRRLFPHDTMAILFPFIFTINKTPSVLLQVQQNWLQERVKFCRRMYSFQTDWCLPPKPKQHPQHAAPQEYHNKGVTQQRNILSYFPQNNNATFQRDNWKERFLCECTSGEIPFFGNHALL